MGNYEQLKQSVSDVIKTNGNQEITGSILQNVLLTIISTVGANATFAGIATPATNPGTPDGPVFYLASEGGIYTNFNAIELQDGLSILMWSNSSWSSQQIFGVDDEPTDGSDNLVKSGGVQEELALGAVYDVSAKNPTGGSNNDGKWESLSVLLSDANLSTLIPTPVRKGGMSIKFVQSSDNNYIQARLMANSFTTDITQWQIVDKELILGSKNLIESGAVYSAVRPLKSKTENIEQSNTQSESDEIIITDNSDNEVVHIYPNGVDAKNLKSNGKRCLNTDDINPNIEQSETQDESSEVEFANSNNNTILKIDDNGVFDKNGNEILGGGLSDKKAIFFGDSITEGIATADWQKQWFGGWPRLLRDNAGMTVSNKGIGGTTLRDNAQNSNGICQRLIADTTLNQYDYIILSGGFNDFANWTADDGLITNGYNSAFDTTKSMGALENCINYLQKNFPDKHIGFILCYSIGATAYDTYYEKIVEVLEKWSMPYIDLRKESAFNINNYDQCHVYGVYKGNIAWFDSTQNYETDDKCQYNGVVYSAKHNITAGGSFNEDDWILSPEGPSDNWHINVIGYRKSFTQIKSWIETL